MSFFDIKLSPTKKNKNVIILNFPYWFRFFLLSIALFIFIMLIITSKNNNINFFSSYNLIPLIILFLLIIFSMYNECWIFDKRKKYISQQNGLLFLYRTKRIMKNDLLEIELILLDKKSMINLSKQNNKSKYKDKIIRLGLITKDEKTIIIEYYKLYQLAKIKKISQQIALYCGIDLKIK